MKRLRFIIPVLLWASAVFGGLRSPGRYAGVVLFDRWDTCYLYSGIYLMYISEDVKNEIRARNREAVLIEALQVLQPINPGEGLIAKFKYLGQPPEDPQSKDLRLTATACFSNNAAICLTLSNRSQDAIRIDLNELGITFLTKKPDNYFGPSDGASFAVFDRQGAQGLVGPADQPSYSGRAHIGSAACSWSIPEREAVPLVSDIPAGGTRSLTILFSLPPGQYDFVAGFGGGVHAKRTVASNMIAFDIDRNAKAKVAMIKER